MLCEGIKDLSLKYYDKVVKLRHLIHMYPELAFEEVKTSKLVAEELKNLDIEVTEGVAKTGVVGLIQGKQPGKTLLLRADMDALAVNEEAEVPYKSKLPGRMHACGHDGHTAGLLGAAMILNELKGEFYGNIKLVFQPAEEADGGAKPMIDEGVLYNPRVDAAIACHLWGDVPEGSVKILKGPVMASPDVFTFRIIGKGGHAAMPHQTIDPVVIAASAINNIQQIISRRKDPLKPAVISCCSIHGGDTYNVIPDHVEVKGTVRTFDKDVRGEMPKLMEHVLKGVTRYQGASYDFEFTKRFPPLINDEKMADLAVKSLSRFIAPSKIIQGGMSYMGGEDFAYFAERVPSVFYFIGISKDMNDPVIQHSSKFAWDDKNMLLQMQSLAQMSIDFLNKKEEPYGKEEMV